MKNVLIGFIMFFMEVERTLPAEVYHVNGADVVVNNEQRAVSSEELKMLVEKITSSIKGGNPRFPFMDWDKTGVQMRFFVDNIKNPKYFMKEKQMNLIRSILRASRNTLANDNTSWARDIKSTDTSRASIHHEIRLASKVKRVIDSDEVQQIFASPLISLIDFVEPLAGVIFREQGSKYMIYPYVNGVSFQDLSTEQKSELAYIKSSMTKLINIFRQNGIEPNDIMWYDSPFRQLIFEVLPSGKIHIHLVDTESYHDIVSDKS